MRKLLLLLLFLIAAQVYSQNCVIQESGNVVCITNTSVFGVTFNTGLTPTSYSWNFGNTATSTQAAPVYQYPTRGTYVPTVTVTFASGPPCTVSGSPIKVVDNPKADFQVTSKDTQCFQNNGVCLTDLSTVGLDNAPLKSRLTLFGDGAFDNSAPGSSIGCHSYVNPLGGTYSLVIEVTDTNNCLSRKELTNKLFVRAKIQDLSFTTSYTVQCTQTPVLFTNTSKISQFSVASYKWDFGDSTFATSPWTGFTHVYTATGIFDARLSIIDINGCTDTFTLSHAGENSKIDSVMLINSPIQCIGKNYFDLQVRSFSTTSKVFWAVYKVGDPTIFDTVANKNEYIGIFANCGQYKVKMYVTLGSCKAYKDTLIEALGPKARIDIPGDPIRNSVQCEIHDTVFFRNPTLDHSCYYKNGAIYRLWDFDDVFAPACTTDTKNNQNVGVNCRYSKDSAFVWHKYDQGKEKCYIPKLILTDPISGCSDTSRGSLKLTAPDAGWDSTSNPIRPGLTYSGKPCMNVGFNFSLLKTLPSCGREKAWFMPDSICPGATWIPIDTLVDSFTYVYIKTCNPTGYVTVGLIIKNGTDKNGNACYDTAWYHNFLKFLPLDPAFYAQRINSGCGPWQFKITLLDSIQDSLVQAKFTFDTQASSTLNFGPTDSIIPSQYVTFTTPGIKKIVLTMKNTLGCSQTYQTFISLGKIASYAPQKEIVCLGDMDTLIDRVSYYNSPINYWRDSTRAKAGKERLYWDLGLGTGFSLNGPLPGIKYPRVGNYQTYMVAIDSMGCADTIKYTKTIKVIDVQSAIKPMLPRYLCAPQILSFSSQSIYLDSSATAKPKQSPYDSIQSYVWDFGEKKNLSFLKNPVYDYTANGHYSVKLVVKTYSGCLDSTTIPIFIDGPQPSFDILSDTVGCAPLKVVFKNTTNKQLIQWIWFYRDQNNTIGSTTLDTNVSFTYTKAGIYKIYLLGEDTLFDPVIGQVKSCRAVFPDSLNASSPRRTVRVIQGATSKIIGPDTVCLYTPFKLIARPDRLVNGFSWNLGDTLFQKLWPDTTATHLYTKSGDYKIRLFPLNTGAICTDSTFKNIHVPLIKADFTLDDSQAPLYKFTNQSQFAVRYQWNFGQLRSGAQNLSTDVNPSHNYGADTGIFLVCLRAYNSSDCYDSICKPTNPKVYLNIPNVFTPNNDGKNDAFDIDIQGGAYYDLVIYNRWGETVYEGKSDGIGNDGNNWNGTDHNKGKECEQGVYFFIFKYRLLTMEKPGEAHGSVTLIRD